MSKRQAASKLSGRNLQLKSLPVKIPVTIRPDSFASGITVQVKKVAADISELKKNITVESAARQELKISVEELKAENVEIKKHLTQEAKELRLKARGGGGTQSLHVFMKMLPCTSLIELNLLRDCIEIRTNFLQWVRYFAGLYAHISIFLAFRFNSLNL